MKILNVAAGKQKPLSVLNKKIIGSYFLINLDTSYYSAWSAEKIEHDGTFWDSNQTKRDTYECFCNEDAYEFMERTRLIFDIVCIYRFLEHVPFDRLLYFIYLLSTITRKGSVVDIIVPNYEILAKMLLEEDVYSSNFEANNILLTTEIVNEPGCPHASLWTPSRAVKFFGLEKRFQVHKMVSPYEFDGRNIYMRFHAKRV